MQRTRARGAIQPAYDRSRRRANDCARRETDQRTASADERARADPGGCARARRGGRADRRGNGSQTGGRLQRRRRSDAAHVCGSQRPQAGPAQHRPRVDDGYLAFPRAALYKSVAEPPGHGSDVSVLTLSYYPPFTPLEQNPALQEINKQLNATLHLNMVAPTDYLTRFNTTIAGGSLPDLMMLGVIPNAAEFLQSQCADLTPYLSGDAVKAYPNLANLPSLAWKSTIYNGAIMGVPPPRSAPSSVLYVNRSRYEQEIGNTMPKNADDWKRILVQLPIRRRGGGPSPRAARGSASASRQRGTRGCSGRPTRGAWMPAGN